MHNFRFFSLEEIEILSMALATEVRETQKWIRFHNDEMNEGAGGDAVVADLTNQLSRVMEMERRVNEFWREQELLITRG